MGRKQFGKGRKCWLTAFSPFPTMFSKGLSLRVVKSRDCVRKSQTSNTEFVFQRSQMLLYATDHK